MHITCKIKDVSDHTSYEVVLAHSTANPEAVIAANLLETLAREQTIVTDQGTAIAARLVNIPTADEIERHVREGTNFILTDGDNIPDLIAEYNGRTKTLTCNAGGEDWTTHYTYEIAA